MFATPDEVNRFWLDEVGEKGWYNGTPALDQAIRDRFMATWENAAALAPAWAGTAHGALAALILTDQFPRNMFRGDPRAFATDALARHIADGAIAAGFDHQIDPPARQFFYMPFEHSENPADQALAVEFMTGRMPSDPDMALHARAHQAVIARFGRFPHRNAILGRASTDAERAYLAQPGAGF